jgi:hypothetical protein
MLGGLLLAEAAKLKINKELYDELIKITERLGEDQALVKTIKNSLEIIGADESSEFKKKVESFLQEYKNSEHPVFTFSRSQGSELIIRFVGDKNLPIKSAVQESLKQLAEFLKSELGKQDIVYNNDYFIKTKLEKGKLIITAKATVINQIGVFLKETGLSCSDKKQLTKIKTFFFNPNNGF